MAFKIGEWVASSFQHYSWQNVWKEREKKKTIDFTEAAVSALDREPEPRVTAAIVLTKIDK